MSRKHGVLQALRVLTLICLPVAFCGIFIGFLSGGTLVVFGLQIKVWLLSAVLTFTALRYLRRLRQIEQNPKVLAPPVFDSDSREHPQTGSPDLEPRIHRE